VRRWATRTSDLGENALVDECGPLAYEGHAETASAPAADEVVDGADESFGAALDALRNEGVRFVDGEMESLAILAVETLGEVGHETSGGALGEVADVEDDGLARVDDEVGQDLPGGLLEGDVALFAAEDVDRQALVETVLRRPKAPPDSDGIDDDRR
jgi:hypothetical protein